jgi:uncharacterized protein (UPF0216 family)
VSDKSFDRYESLLSNILRSVNDSLPKHVVRYRDVVELGMEGVETVGGSFHRFDRNDLEKLAKQLPENILDRLHLPFVFVKSIEIEESVYILRVYGSEAEAFQMLMGLENTPPNQPRPLHLQAFRRRVYQQVPKPRSPRLPLATPTPPT